MLEPSNDGGMNQYVYIYIHIYNTEIKNMIHTYYKLGTNIPNNLQSTHIKL